MPDPLWLARWQQRDDDELLYASLSDVPPEAPPDAQEWWGALYLPLSHPTPRTGPRVFWPGYDRYLEGRPRQGEAL
jgi:hypothetical protein